MKVSAMNVTFFSMIINFYKTIVFSVNNIYLLQYKFKSNGHDMHHIGLQVFHLGLAPPRLYVLRVKLIQARIPPYNKILRNQNTKMIFFWVYSMVEIISLAKERTYTRSNLQFNDKIVDDGTNILKFIKDIKYFYKYFLF